MMKLAWRWHAWFSLGGGIDVRALSRGLATLYPGCSQQPLVVNGGMEDLKRTRPPAGALLLCMQRWCNAGRFTLGEQVSGTWYLKFCLSSLILGFLWACFYVLYLCYGYFESICYIQFSCSVSYLFWCQYLPSDWLERPL